MRPDEFLRKYGIDEKSGDAEREHSLKENAWERAVKLHEPNAGTPHDWEDWQRASREWGVEVSSTDDHDPTRPHHEATRAIDDRPSVMDWLVTRCRRLKRRFLRR